MTPRYTCTAQIRWAQYWALAPRYESAFPPLPTLVWFDISSPGELVSVERAGWPQVQTDRRRRARERKYGMPVETPSSWEWVDEMFLCAPLCPSPSAAPRLVATKPKWYQFRAASLGDRLGWLEYSRSMAIDPWVCLPCGCICCMALSACLTLDASQRPFLVQCLVRMHVDFRRRPQRCPPSLPKGPCPRVVHG